MSKYTWNQGGSKILVCSHRSFMGTVVLVYALQANRSTTDVTITQVILQVWKSTDMRSFCYNTVFLSLCSGSNDQKHFSVYSVHSQKTFIIHTKLLIPSCYLPLCIMDIPYKMCNCVASCSHTSKRYSINHGGFYVYKGRN